MIKPRVDKLLEQTDSHYAAVLVAAKRARQLNSYYRALGEGTYEEYTPPMVETHSGNYLTIALDELATGLCDSLLTASFLACQAPRAVAPAMNDRMYRDAATQANLATLRGRGVRVIDPDEGPLASRGEHGIGRLPAPTRLLAGVEALLPRAPGPWDGLRVLVTAGGTREPIDAVRFIGNRSSGRMGLALAAA